MSDATYCTEWYNLTVKDRKMFLLLLHQTQMKINLNAYGLVEVNAATFAKVISNCFFFCIFKYYTKVLNLFIGNKRCLQLCSNCSKTILKSDII